MISEKNEDFLHCGLEQYPQETDLERENRLLKEEIKKLKQENTRKYLPTLGELLDRLSITQIKEVKISEHKDKYAQEIEEIMHDIDIIIQNHDIQFDASMLRDLIIVAEYNLHIWHNESEARKGNKDGNNLFLSHGLNSVRNLAKNRIQGCIGGRKDYKLDNVEAFPQWIPSGYK